MYKEAIIIYDGECGICSAIAEWIRSKDKKNQFGILPNQDFDFGQFENNLTINEVMKSVILIEKQNGKYYKASRAVFEIAKKLGGIFKVFGIIGANPFISFILDPIYYIIARNRRQLSLLLGYKACRLDFDNKILEKS
jgi:predicted DCC family thiol-disulfide oxidoreductase YuxK